MILKINFKKLKKYKAKAMFLIAPVTVLIALGLVVSSQVTNINNAADSSIFGTVAESAKLIELKQPARQSGYGSFEEAEKYTEQDLDVIASIDNVMTVNLTNSVPLNKVVVTGLFEENFKTSLTGLDSSLAALYTDLDFTYVEGQSIPVVLSSNTFIYNYEDWNGEDVYEMELKNMRGLSQEEKAEAFNSSPVKKSAIDYTKDDLIGKEFTLQVGGLSDLTSYTTSMDMTNFVRVMTKKTDVEIDLEEQQRQQNIEQYWDYAKIEKPLEYNLVVVGVIEDSGYNDTFIPQEFADKVFVDLVQNQLDARVDNEIVVDSLKSVYDGISFDGYELDAGNSITKAMSKMGMGMRSKSNPQSSGSADSESEVSYVIPGLIISTDSSDQSDTYFGSSVGVAVGIYQDTDAYQIAAKESSTILIKISDVMDREQVAEDLNTLGYAFIDTYKLDVFKELESTLSSISTAVIVMFIILTAVIVTLTLGKFVSESRREIGVFRALGATKADIIKLFVSQAIMYTGIGYIFGSIIGFVGVLILSPFAKAYFEDFISDTMRESFNVVVDTNASMFKNIDWSSFATYSILLLVITLVISIWQASRASKVSPVEAIRAE